MVAMLNKLNSLLWGRSLEAYIVSRKPIILITFWHDFLKNYNEVLKIIPKDKTTYILFKFGYYKSSENAVEIGDKVKKIQWDYPLLNCYMLANSIEEKENLCNAKLKTVFVNANAFLKEKRYPILPKIRKKYQAVYLAKFFRVKRHLLARKISKLLLIGSYNPADESYFKNVMASVPKDTVWVRRVFTLHIPKYLNQAEVGLALSDKEGAMYSCTEYMLCGLPVVSTYNKGGREVYLDKYAKIVSPDPDQVKFAVEEMIEKNFSAEDIRKHTIAIMKEHRRRFIELINRIYAETNTDKDFSNEWNKVFVHKMGLRCGILPWIYKNRILKENQEIV
jgi:glycosyltransferase involved in cell wall biosynthesis